MDPRDSNSATHFAVELDGVRSFQAEFERIGDLAPSIGPKTPRVAKPFRSYHFAARPLQC